MLQLDGTPSSVDLTTQFPPIGDQGRAEACVGFSVSYATKTYQEGIEEHWSLTSTSHQFSPSWVWNQLNGGLNQGISVGAALGLLCDDGDDTLMHFPFNDTDFTTQPDSASMGRAAHYEAGDWVTLPNDVSTFKDMLTEGLPVIIAFNVLQDFDTLNSTTNQVYDSNAGPVPPCAAFPARYYIDDLGGHCIAGGHANVIIGYDDTKQAFKTMNSWGVGWGADGYGWLAYSFLTNTDLALGAYVMIDAGNIPFDGVTWFGSDMLLLR